MQLSVKIYLNSLFVKVLGNLKNLVQMKKTWDFQFGH